MNESRTSVAVGQVPATRRDDGAEVRGTLMAAGRQALALAREHPLAALGVLAAFAFVLGRSNRGRDANRHGIW